MKKIFLITLVLTTLTMRSQNSTDHRNTVSVSGKTLVDDATKSYKAKIVLNMDQIYYSNPECKSLDELKETYFKKIKDNGFETSSFKENKMEFITYGYQKDGTIFEFETSDAEKIEALAKIRMTGITTTFQYKSTVSPEVHARLLKKAVEDAEKNAKRVCDVIGGKLGDIISISESFSNNGVWYAYHSGYDEYISVSVTYEMN